MVDSICTLGPIVDAALVPSAYHVPKTATLAGGGSGGGGNRGRSRGHRGGRGGSEAMRAPAGGRGGGSGGGTSGGGIRTSLVCAAGYGGQGSLAVFSAGLRTEVGHLHLFFVVLVVLALLLVDGMVWYGIIWHGMVS